jgi:hypothetical protein
MKVRAQIGLPQRKAATYNKLLFGENDNSTQTGGRVTGFCVALAACLFYADEEIWPFSIQLQGPGGRACCSHHPVETVTPYFHLPDWQTGLADWPRRVAETAQPGRRFY